MANKNVKGITVEIGGNTTGLDKALKNVENSAYKLKSELKEVEKGLKLDPKNMELLSQKSTLLAQSVANAKDKLDSLKSVQGQIEQQFQNGSIGETQYRAFQRELINSENELRKLENELKLANSDMLKFGQAGGTVADQERRMAEEAEKAQRAEDELSNKIEKGKNALGQWGNAFDVVKNVGVATFEAVTGAAVATAAAVAAGAKASVDAYNDVYAGTENVIKATGAVGEIADSLEQSYKNVASTMSAEFADVGAVMGEINTRFGVTDGELEDATKSFLKFAGITGTNATQSVKLVARAMANANIPFEEYDKVLDELAVTAQASGISLDTLASTLSKNGATMRAMDLDTEQSIALLATFEKNGINTETALAGLKKAISTWGKEGKDSREEFSKTIEEIQKMPDAAEATEKAIEIFGAKAGPELADAIQSGRFAYEDFIDVLQNSEGTVENTYAETQNGADKIKTAFNDLKIQASDVGEVISDVMGDYVTEGVELIKDSVDDMSLSAEDLKDLIENKIKPVIENVKDKVKEVIDFVISHKTDIFNAIDTIKSVIEDVLSAVKDIITWLKDNGEYILSLLAGIAAGLVAWNIVSIIQGAIAAFPGFIACFEMLKAQIIGINAALAANPVGIVVTAIAALVAIFIVLWNTCEPFKQFWLDLWEEIKKTVATFLDYWTLGVSIIKQGFEDFINNDHVQRIIYHFQQIIDFIKNIFTGDFESAWENVKNIFKNIWEEFAECMKPSVNSIIGIVNKMIEGINSMIENINLIKIDIPDWVPEIGGSSFGFELPSIPTIPMLAKGGILSSGSAIVGEAGAELLTVANGRAIVQPLSHNSDSQGAIQPVFDSDIIVNAYMYPGANEFTRSVVTANMLNSAVTGGR